MSTLDKSRPRSRWFHAGTWLEDFSILTWDVDPDRLDVLLPDGFEPDVWSDRAWVSMVSFNDVDFHFRGAPFIRMSCGQVNYRAYVRRAERTGVWFFGSSLDSRLVSIPRTLWKMPWHRTSLKIDSTWGPKGCETWDLEGAGSWGAARIQLRGIRSELDPPAGLSARNARSVLFDPTDGWYQRNRDQGVGSYTVWHEPLVLEQAHVDHAECQLFSDLGLVEYGQPPASAGVQRRVHFDVHTPPKRLA